MNWGISDRSMLLDVRGFSLGVKKVALTERKQTEHQAVRDGSASVQPVSDLGTDNTGFESNAPIVREQSRGLG